jgi:molybdopterin converting factor small subunit
VAIVIFPADLQRFTGGATRVEVAAGNYRDLVAELCERYPALTEEALRKQAIAIDGAIIHRPLLETFDNDAELVFVARIAGG